MSAPILIEVTNHSDGRKLWVNAYHIIGITESLDGFTWIIFPNDLDYRVKEGPRELRERIKIEARRLV